ncbi:sensor histidine kinase [Nocardioides zhouii]|uniref:histidine kinase n=1 Tax=Nocardioides zhouii TaxID=1168729 RepID=A0A4Q2T7P8_9ACTN|nr:histidine kinase [Nocardioides zhouii]RYC14832.1 hypothetical protein EUA94_01540 [Nocardioides zhouii]
MIESRAWSWVAVAVAAIALVATPFVRVEAGAPVLDLPLDALFLVAMLSSAGLGLLVLRRRPGHVIGWLLLLNGVVLALTGFVESAAQLSLSGAALSTPVRLAAVWQTHGWSATFAPLVALAWVFPDGRLLSRRWRVPAALGTASFVVTLASGVLSRSPLDRPYDVVPPLAVLPDGVGSALQLVGLLGMLLTFVAGFACLVMRFRASRGVERHQLKWIALSGASVPVSIACGILDPGTDGPTAVTVVPFVLMLVVVPLSISIAVLRYRLYDIDRLISVAVLYGVLTALLGGAFVGVIVLGGVVLGDGSTITTAVATLGVALAFRPLRDRTQRRVDHRFNRARYDAMEAVDAFLDDVRSGRVEPEVVAGVLARGLRDPTLRLYFWLPDPGVHADSAGRLVPQLPDHPVGRTPIRRGDLLVATLIHDPDTGSAPGTMDAVLVRAGLAIEVARLRVEVRRQLAEVQDSRLRILSATQAERRRLERDLHDGAQQRLVSVGLDLRHLQQTLSDKRVSIALDGAVSGLSEAIQELRDLANGVRPNALDAGLASAFSGLAASARLPTAVDATDQRFAPEIEAAAYFVASEGLANAVKHSGASRVRLIAAHADGVLRVAVVDDGRGGATPGGGSGLVGLADRLASVGGRLAIDSGPGRGTRLEVEIPCA